MGKIEAARKGDLKNPYNAQRSAALLRSAT